MLEQTLPPSAEPTWENIAAQAQNGEIHEGLLPHVNRLLAEHGVEYVPPTAPGAEILNTSIAEASDLADRVVQTPGTSEISVVNTELTHRAEAATQHSDEEVAKSSLLDALIVGIQEVQTTPDNPLETVIQDGVVPRKDVTHAIETIADAGATNVAETMARRITEVEHSANSTNLLGTKFIENTPLESQIRKHYGMPEGVGTIRVVSQPEQRLVDQAVGNVLRLHNSMQRAWQERVFGKVELAELRQDALDHFEKPVLERKGEPIMVDGQEKRPIMDISLDAAAKAEVQTMLVERAQGLTSMLEKLRDLQTSGIKMPMSQIEELLYQSKAWSRPQGNFIGVTGREGQNTGGTVADLYLDSNDLQKYDQIDQLLQQVHHGFTISSREQLANRILQLASSSFPSGVELVHAIKHDTIPDILDHGALATRSQRRHGSQQFNPRLNGAFIHMTGPGDLVVGYGASLVAGIPIDTIIRHSPYLHLEDDLTHNKTPRGGSMQYHMQPMTLNSLDDAPLAFRTALESLHANIAKGLADVDIAEGRYDNWSFSAGATPDTAGQYSYPLTELSLYATPHGQEAAWQHTNAQQKKLFIDRATIFYPAEEDTGLVKTNIQNLHILGGEKAVLLNAATLPNFTLNEKGGLVLYAPASAREVPFGESKAGNSTEYTSLGFKLENIKPEAVPQHIDGLIADGMSPTDAFQAALESVNTKGGSAVGLISSYVGGMSTLLKAGISPTEFMNGFSDQTIKDKGTTMLRRIENLYDETERADPSKMAEDVRWFYESWNERGQYASPAIKASLIKPLGDRLYTVAPEAFARNVARLEQYGYVLTDTQKQAVEAITAKA
jgi:hypothetical protein